jgi:hypothetical protein
MTIDQHGVAEILAKEKIRELVLLYSRGVDRKDAALLRSLYTEDAIDNHDETYRGPATGYVDFLERSFPHLPYSGHHVCNHLISVDPSAGTGEGEVYALAYHVFPAKDGTFIEDIMCVRYIDRYREVDGHWRFARRDVFYDKRTQRPCDAPRATSDLFRDGSYDLLTSRLFGRGSRT